MLKLYGNRSDLSGSQLQHHIIVIENPLYSLENPLIKKIIELADKLKEEGYFPLDYKLEQSILEHQED